MKRQSAGKRENCAGLLGRVMTIAFGRSAVFYTILLALLLSGTVPQGFMRATDGDGMAIVLCTPNGMSEVWLTANGDVQDEAPVDSSSSEISSCLAITVALTAVQGAIETLGQTIEIAPYQTVLVDRRGAVTPALTPLQPRAPPIAA